VVHVTAEMAPIAKVGGLGDVVTGLARAHLCAGHNVEVVSHSCVSDGLHGPYWLSKLSLVSLFLWGKNKSNDEQYFWEERLKFCFTHNHNTHNTHTEAVVTPSRGDCLQLKRVLTARITL
jgi:glycogen synthase